MKLEMTNEAIVITNDDGATCEIPITYSEDTGKYRVDFSKIGELILPTTSTTTKNAIWIAS